MIQAFRYISSGFISIVKVNLFILVLLLKTPSALAINEFEWFDLKQKKFERISLTSKSFEIRTLNGVWTKKFDLEFDGVDLKEIPADSSPLRFDYKGNYLITIPGTGQVYLFDFKKKFLQRIDKTFFRGYNFHAIQFVRNNELFSLGGHGFWDVSNKLTYFDFKSKEWEPVEMKGTVPSGISSSVGGLYKGNDKIIALESLHGNANSEIYFSLFEYTLSNNTWKKLGGVEWLNLIKLGLTSGNFKILGNLIFFVDPDFGLFADPNDNKLLLYQGKRKSFFLTESKLLSQGNWLYSLRIDKNNPTGSMKLDSMTFDELRKNSISKGQFYSKEPYFSKNQIIYFLLGLLLFISILINLLLFKRSSKNNMIAGTISIPNGGVEFLELFKKHGENYLVSSEEISIILGSEKKAFDTQRQYRAQFLNSLNQYFLINHQIDEAIFRKTTEEDKRYMKYCIKPEALRVSQIIH